jgi:glycosyltransferase involved in cell wall biosynthesis
MRRRGMIRSRRDVKRVAIIHDWLTGMRGGEVVLEEILELFPQAEIFTLLYNRGSLSERIAAHTIHTSFIDSLPFKKGKYRHYLPLFPTAIERFDLRGYDLVISSSHCVARGVIVPPGTPHVSFIHSPMRYVWDMYPDYFPAKGFLNRWVIPYFANYLRIWDASAAPRVDRYVANSAFVAERIRRYYGRVASVVHPPCVPDGVRIPQRRRGGYYLVVSALVPYKRIDLAIEALRGLDRKLVIAGDGPEAKRLRASAPANVTFIPGLSREEIQELYSGASALIFPGVEDFGIVPVEAQANGCPIIAYGRGGALETVANGKTGLFFDEQTPESLREAIAKSERLRFDSGAFQKNIARFTRKRFRQEFMREVELAMKGRYSP